MDVRRVYRLRNVVQHYDWGSHTAIPELLGEPSPSERPCAELWMGAHPKAPSQVLVGDGEIGLDAFVASDPKGVLGARVAERFDGRLPFLFKVLAAERPLSIQAHPSLEQARQGFQRENEEGIPLASPRRCYVDANHKPELICALTPFHALNRFRPPGDVAARVGALGAPELEPLLRDLRDRPDRRGLAAFFRGLWELPEAARGAVLERAASRAKGADAEDAAWRWVAQLAARHPGDVGALAPLLLNVVALAPGQAMFLPAGELHSYLGGVGIEVMASSDNVLRGGLTAKHVDVPELLRTLGFRSGPVEILEPRPGGSGEGCYDTPAEEFALACLRVGPRRPFVSAEARGIEILLCTEGEGRLSASESLGFRRGDSLLVPAAAPAYRVEGEATLYRAAAA